LLIDLKKRQLLQRGQVELRAEIGARRIQVHYHSILRNDFGIVGAICINIDANYLRRSNESKERIEAWFKNFCRTDMQADENI